MKLKLKRLKLEAGKPIAFIHKIDAKKIGAHAGESILIKFNGRSENVIIDTVENYLREGEIALSNEVLSYLKAKNQDYLDICLGHISEAKKYIDGRGKCDPYTKDQLKKIIQGVVKNELSEAEIAYFISGVNYCGMTSEETKYLIEAIVGTGKRINWGTRIIADKHSIGGIPGNRTTPIVVSICAAAGIVMPKTSSRAITSAAGTADVIECLSRVDFSVEDLKKIVKKTGACLAWGGSLGLAPADDKLIQVEKLLNVDPEPQLLASILSKKIAVGSTHVLIDIPYGLGAKVSKSQGLLLRDKFVSLGKKLGLVIRVVLTDGRQPIGNGIGPILETKDVLSVLRREDSPKDLENKSLLLAGELLEMLGKASRGKGRNKAKEILDSGQALRKFEEIITAQKGKLDGFPEASYQKNVLATRSGKIKEINNKRVNSLARFLGCPKDKSAGVYLYKHVNSMVKKGDILAALYAESKPKLIQGLEYLNTNMPIVVE